MSHSHFQRILTALVLLPFLFISSGYRSTPHLPMVQTSSTGSSTVMTP